ncbi:MAG: hypothetical protein RL748_839 [Pseudomonadota bacterium]|jgi:hypothetical protein
MMNTFSDQNTDQIGLDLIQSAAMNYRLPEDDDAMVLRLVKHGLASGPSVPLDDNFFAELDAIIAQSAAPR